MSGNGETVSIHILPVSQPIGDFYVGIIEADDLRAIAFADTRRQKGREIELFTGIQRELSEKRRKEINQYIRSFDASFPNSFIIEVKSEDVLREKEGVVEIRKHERAARIIDGQHRLAGFDETNSKGFQLIVSLFIDLPLEQQAMLFATINLKQTRVNESLVYDLFEETRMRSPQKTAHDVAKSLNRDSESPFFHQIKPLGKRLDEYAGRLSQATFVKRFMPHICDNPDEVRDAIRRGDSPKPDDSRNRERVFWRFFCEEQDWAIQKALKNYFSAVADVFPSDWHSQDSPLGRTIGFSALMRLLGDLAKKGLSAKPEPRLDQNFFLDFFTRAKSLSPFTFDAYSPSGSGESKLYNDLRSAVLNE
jgi:DGQHR domain-containing protein